jgi:hypothetical protein
MRGFAGTAVCASCLLAAPAGARDIAGPADLRIDSPVVASVASLPAERDPVPADGPRIRFSNDLIVLQDGSPGDRRAVVGSLPLVGPVAAEIGLFSVTGAEVKEREFKRTDPVADVQPRRSRVAAVGLRMRF